jgi:ATP-dependent DNA helicase RecQ
MSADDIRDQLAAVGRRVFGWPTLRPQQLDAMEAIVAGRDVLAVMPTGSGKSAIYQVPSVLLSGSTLVVSPLIALQRDQIAALSDAGVSTAVAINSGQRTSRTSRAWEAVRHNDADYVFVSPEQLAKDRVVSRLADTRFTLIVVDEAHCVSSWGHDFRPDYLRLADAFARIGASIPVAALTATASPIVRREIVEQLRLREPATVVAGFDRPNIRLLVRQHLSDADKRDAAMKAVPDLPGPGLLYVATRKDAQQYADALSDNGIRAAAYHAGMTAAERDAVHEGFRDDRYDVVTATSAFGMGIDKPNVRFVAHASIPESLDTYYQQIGRAGRDGDPATALLFYRTEDLGLAKFFTSQRPDAALLRTVYCTLNVLGPQRLKSLRDAVKVRGRRLTNAVNLLDDAGAVRSTRKGFVAEGEGADAAVDAALQVVEMRERVEQSRVEMMRGYAETRSCRRQFLLSYFGEELPGRCENCDRCLSAEHDDNVHMNRPPIDVNTAVRHREWGDGVVIGGDTDRLTVLFDEYGYRVLSMPAVKEQDLLRMR